MQKRGGALVNGDNLEGPVEAPDAIRRLVKRFREHEATYRQTYSEAQVRQDFIDPFFRALGWDVNNEKGFAEAYREVVVEDALRIDGHVKAPDYAFRIGTTKKFYVEAKKPLIDLDKDPGPALQLRRYGWNAKLGVSILTDFETLAVYDCSVKPEAGDRASTARLEFLHYSEYEERWSELFNLFSPDAIMKGRLDAFNGSPRKRRNTAQVDESLLAEIRKWREQLAKNVALRNAHLSVDDLNYVVQTVLDRIIFLRICEDRRIEPDGQLLDLAAKPGIYDALQRLFLQADAKYNSGLFHLEAEPGRKQGVDLLTPSVSIDDSPLKSILLDLYFPRSPFEFSIIPADILGQIYEQFLGETIRLTPAHRAVVEVKPEVRKAGGVYYTPTDVVRDIIDKTIGPSLASATPKQLQPSIGSVSPLAILDPACGSGTFLLEAYQLLLDWYLEKYTSEEGKWAKGKSPRIARIGKKQWRLTSQERKRILLAHIFGVDVDPHAVEVTKLSLLLKVLEGETDESINAQLGLFHTRALPDLELNVRCGNSLISTDFYGLASAAGLSSEDLRRLNPFDWGDEFSDVSKAGGFTAIIGNPPYVLMQNAGLPLQEAYLSTHYESAKYKIDTFHVFMERSLQLLRPGGRLGFITPSSFMLNRHAMQLREYLLREAQCESLRVNLYQVFRGASVDTTVSIWRKGSGKKKERTAITLADDSARLRQMPGVLQTSWADTRRKSMLVLLNDESLPTVRALEKNTVPLGDFATAYFGIQTNDRATYVSATRRSPKWKPALDGGNITQYHLTPPTEYVCVEPSAIKSGGQHSVHEAPRIGVRQIGSSPIAAMVPGGWYSLNTIYNIYFTKPTPYDLRFILALLNSSVLADYWRVVNWDQKPTFPKIKKDALLEVPVPLLNFKEPTDKALQDAICAEVDQLTSTYDELASATLNTRRQQLTRQAASLTRSIELRLRQAYGV